ncbi:hypothetical protein CBR_g50997 [Chara braunii]|uniref:Uncharacterized protein n=1 Tax=Chara braunii TaxID=69332 RepID=A0A388M851_CHABU|nr:hypothetical protein CBR_g50997 [Chara braunii]|eukprot:GBG90649.1 hypothetical protein CBR_g50997 [Chara braunii]
MDVGIHSVNKSERCGRQHKVGEVCEDGRDDDKTDAKATNKMKSPAAGGKVGSDGVSSQQELANSFTSDGNEDSVFGKYLLGIDGEGGGLINDNQRSNCCSESDIPMYGFSDDNEGIVSSSGTGNGSSVNRNRGKKNVTGGENGDEQVDTGKKEEEEEGEGEDKGWGWGMGERDKSHGRQYEFAEGITWSKLLQRQTSRLTSGA